MNKKIFYFITLIFVLTFTLNLFPDTYSAKVIGVMDGDSIKVLRDKHQVKIRVYGVDCPEKKQPFGARAKQFTSSLVFGRIVSVKEMDTDRYGRTVALINIYEKSLSRELIVNGYAWVYSQYCDKDFCSRWIKYQDAARKKKLGLWSKPDPIAPWVFRKKRKR